MANCFVIMPITTPDAVAAAYGGDSEHFSHVLNYLFVPAITKAKFEVVEPAAQGADVIHAEIIKNLETADLVLCDISTLNPNVFFELGCRTALNKAVCYVKDDLTRRIPFDTGIINHHTYGNTLAPWSLDSEIDRLADHIRSSAERSDGNNMLWQYFGLRSRAHAAPGRGGEEDQLAYLLMQIEAIKESLDDQKRLSKTPPTAYSVDYDMPKASTFTADTLPTLARNWQQDLANAEHDLEEILRTHKPNLLPLRLEEIKYLVDAHIKALGELIRAAPAGVDITRARTLRARYRGLSTGRKAE